MFEFIILLLVWIQLKFRLGQKKSDFFSILPNSIEINKMHNNISQSVTSLLHTKNVFHTFTKKKSFTPLYSLSHSRSVLHIFTWFYTVEVFHIFLLAFTEERCCSLFYQQEVKVFLTLLRTKISYKLQTKHPRVYDRQNKMIKSIFFLLFD